MKISFDVTSFELIAVGLAVAIVMDHIGGRSLIDIAMDRKLAKKEEAKVDRVDYSTPKPEPVEVKPVIDSEPEITIDFTTEGPIVFTFRSRKDAENVLSEMHTIIDQYGIISLSDVKELIGIPAAFKDNQVGWTKLDDEINIRKVMEEYVIDLPEMKKL